MWNRLMIEPIECTYWIILDCKYTRKLVLFPGMRKVSRNHIHSIINLVPTLEEEEEDIFLKT